MVIKVYSVTLDEEIVDRAKKHAEKYGSKLSPLINQLLLAWSLQEEKKWESTSSE